MASLDVWRLFDLEGSIAVVTGASGVLGRAAALGLARAGVSVGLLGRREDALKQVAREIERGGGRALILAADVLDRRQLEAAREEILGRFGRVDHLLNYAGGNRSEATASPGRRFFELRKEALQAAVELNVLGTILPCQVFGEPMAERRQGCILNVSSMAAVRPLTGVGAYAAAKAAVDNFTRWLAVHMAQNYSPSIRVNAIAPGFFRTEQNRFLLTDEQTGELTPRGRDILAHTPAGRFGEPDDLLGAILLLLSPASKFVTGVVLPVDGGFAAFGGV